MAQLTWPQGNTRTLQPFTLQDGQGSSTSAVDLTNNSGIVLTISRQSYPQTVYTALTGTPTVTNAPAGQFSWKFSAADVASPGTYWVVITVNYVGGDTWKSLPFTFVIEETG